MSCAVCGGEAMCHLTHGTMGNVDFLSAEDWRQVHEFMRDVQLPFMHRVIERAAKRNNIDFTQWRKSKREITKREMEALNK